MAKLGESKGAPSVFARRLRQARLRRGLSQKALGIAIGVDPSGASSRINQYERGKHAPDYATAERIARALGVPTPYLFAREEAVAELILAPALQQPEAEYVLSSKELVRRFRKLKTGHQAVVARLITALAARAKDKS
jgi:transcriptional regulator with XRE-family HTH domain